MGNCCRSTDCHAVNELVSPFEWLSNSSKEKHEQHFCHAQLSSPLGVFAGAQGILQPHSSRSCHTRSSFNVSLSLSLPQGIMLSPKSQAAVVLSCSPWTFAVGWEAGRWNIFGIPCCCVLPELRRPRGITSNHHHCCRQRAVQKGFRVGICETQRRSGAGWGARWKSPMTSPNWGQCHISLQLWYPQGSSSSPPNPCSCYTLGNSLGFKSSSIWALFSSSPSLHTPWTWCWLLLQCSVWEQWSLD